MQMENGKNGTSTEDTDIGVRITNQEKSLDPEPGSDDTFSLHLADTPFHILMDEMNDGVVTLTSDGVVQYCNSRFAEMVRCPTVHVIGAKFNTFIARASRETFDRLFEDGSSGRSRGEIIGRASDGVCFSLQLSIRHLPESGPANVGIIAVDLTETKRTNFELHQLNANLERRVSERTAELRESEQRLQFVLDSAHFGAWDIDLADLTVFRSPEHDRIFGYDQMQPEWTLAMSIEHILPEFRSAVEASILDSAVTFNGFSGECEILRADGEVRWIKFLGRPYRDSIGHDRVAGIIEDITDKKLTDDALRKSIERYRLLAETMLQGVVHQDREGTVIHMNPAAEQILGKTREEFLGSTSKLEEHDTIRDDGRSFPGEEHPSMIALATGKSVRGVPMGVFNPRLNEYRWIEIDAVPLFKPGSDTAEEVYTVFADITDRRRSEEEIRELNIGLEKRVAERTAELKEAQRLAKMGYWQFDARTNAVHWSPELCRIMGLDPELPAPAIDNQEHLFANDSWTRLSRAITKSVNYGVPYEIEVEVIVADGTTKWMLNRGAPMIDADGTIIGAKGSAMDITALRSAKQALKESEERWKFALEGSGDGVWDWDVRDDSVFYSTRWKQMLGFADSEIGTGLDEWSKRVHPDDMDGVMAELQPHLDGLTPSYSHEHRVRCKDGTYKWILDRGLVTSRDADGKPLRAVGTHTDITERKRNEAELQKVSSELQGVLESSGDVIAVLNTEYCYTLFNPAFAEEFYRIFGRKLEPGDSMIESLRHTPDDLVAATGYWKRALAGEDFIVTTEFGVSDRERNWYDLHFSPIRDNNGDIVGAVHIVRNVTERKRSENQILRLLDFSQGTIDSLSSNLCVLDTDGTILTVNRGWEEFANEFSDDFSEVGIGANYFHVCESARGEDSEAAAKMLAGIKSVASGEVAEFWIEYPCHTPFEEMHYLARVTRFLEAGELRLVISHTNVTDQVKVRSELEEAQQKLNQAVDQARLAHWEFDIDTETFTFNDRFYSLYGTSANSLGGYQMSLDDYKDRFVRPEDAGIVDEFRSRLRSEIGEFRMEHRVRVFDGNVIYVLARIAATRDEAGNVIGVQGSVQDITEQKKAEESLRESEERFRTMADTAPVLIWIAGLDKLCFYFNKVWLDFTGRTIDQEMGNGWAEGVHADDMDRCLQIYSTAFDERESFSMEYRLRRHDGEYRWILDNGVPRFTPDGSFVGYIGSCTDITDRKQTEAALEDSEKRWHFATEGAGDGVWDWQGSFNSVYLSPRWKEMLGYREDEIGNKHEDWQDLIHPNDKEGVVGEMERHLNGETDIYTCIYRLRCKDGGYKWILARGVATERDANGIALRVVGTHKDITEQKLADDILNETQSRLNLTMDQAKLAYWEVDIPSGDIIANDRFYTLLGTSYETEGSYRMSLSKYARELIPEEDQHLVGKVSKRLDTDEDEVHVEHRIVRRDGEMRHVLVHINAVRDQNGKRIGSRGSTQDITDIKEAQEALRVAHERIKLFIDANLFGVFICERDGRVLEANDYYLALTGWTRDQFERESLNWRNITPPEWADADNKALAELAAKRYCAPFEKQYVRPDGSKVDLLMSNRMLTIDNQEVITGFALDITERKSLEEQLVQSQKLESLGRLAGGIAHDFNNMLTAVNGFSDLALNRLSEDDPNRKNIEFVRQAGERASALTKQLLAFSRRQMLSPQLVNINEAIIESNRLLSPLIGENIELKTDFGPGDNFVKVDPGQLSQILMNLSINARDAMPDGGSLVVRTERTAIDSQMAERQLNVAPGNYIMISVSDTGKGIPPGLRERIFEPFFSTKEIGKGTGLGLATVYGIVKQSGGGILVESEPETGTTFKIFLPSAQSASRETGENAVFGTGSGIGSVLPSDKFRGSETILLVEDEEMVRAMTKQLLRSCGYTVIEARDGIEALEIAENATTHFDLLLTDIVMPRMGGRELSKRLENKMPNLPVLFVSGYTADNFINEDDAENYRRFVQKPYKINDLAKKIRELIDSKNEDPRSTPSE